MYYNNIHCNTANVGIGAYIIKIMYRYVAECGSIP